MNSPSVVVGLTRFEAVVFVDFLMRYRDKARLSVVHEAETQLLYELCGMVEQQLPELFDPAWRLLIERARAEVLADPDV